MGVEKTFTEFNKTDNFINNDSYNINILTYGKKLPYILRYIQFLLINVEIPENTNFFIFCDIKTYNCHMANLAAILKKTSEIIQSSGHLNIPEIDTTEIYNFKQFLV